VGSPLLCVISRHVSPPSTLFQMPLRPPPAIMLHGVRWNFHIAAKRIRGFVGSIARSMAPVLSLMKSTFCHVLPPSEERNTPRSALGPKAWPMAAMNTRSGSRGSISMSAIWCVSRSPSGCHERPASLERYMPVPYVRSSRRSFSPVPTYITLGSLGATAIAPTEEMSLTPSVTLRQDCPAFVVFHTPPFTAPK
jgi:hypothetical protein